ncbi:MAG: Gldg family protein [Candidatus Hodarchaeota archaeon]
MRSKIKVAFDRTHKEILKIGKTGEHEWESWANAEELIRKKGFENINLEKSALKYSDLSQYNILIIGAPQTKFSDDEISSIVQFVKKGGNLLAINEQGGDLRNNTNLSEITKNFGIEFNNDMIHDKVHNIKGYAYGPVISDFQYCSSLTFNIREFNILLGCSLKVSNEALIVARSSKDSYVKIKTPSGKWIKREGASLPVLAAYESAGEGGRVVAIGDPHVFSDDDVGMPLYNNRVLFNNIIDWLSEPSLNAEEKFLILSNKINKISDDLVRLKKKMGIIETGDSVYRSGTYLPDEIVARIDQLETSLKSTDKKIEEEEIKYYKSRIRLEIWAIIISFLSLIAVIIIALFIRPSL